MNGKECGHDENAKLECAPAERMVAAAGDAPADQLPTRSLAISAAVRREKLSRSTQWH